MQLSFTFCIGLVRFLKHVLLLSFQIDHHIQDGTRFHHPSCVLLRPLLIQQLSRSASILRNHPRILDKALKHIPYLGRHFSVKELMVVCFFLFMAEEVPNNLKSYFFNLSRVRHAFLHTDHVKHYISWSAGLPDLFPRSKNATGCVARSL